MSTFDYRKDASGIYFPVVDVTTYHAGNFIKTPALIDSGATISVFRPEVANQLNVDINKGKRIFLRGIAGRIEGYIHKLPVSIAGKQFTCPIVFSNEHLTSFNLFGRKTSASKTFMSKLIFLEK